jgi:virulence-associated protein VagC
MLQITKAFWLGGSQAVRLPPEFWFEGDAVRIERRGSSIVLSPIRGEGHRQVDPSNATTNEERAEVFDNPGGDRLHAKIRSRAMSIIGRRCACRLDLAA